MGQLFDLPFVGRGEEIERIVAFYRSTTTSDRLSVLWLQGPAGVGKSRLLGQVIPQLDDLHPAILHVKSYPDSANSVNDLLTQAMATIPQPLRLLSNIPFEASVLTKLRRIARLRPTVLILEDIHLLDERAASELGQLLHSLSDEPVCVLAVARPGEHASFKAVSSFILESIVLEPLSPDEIFQLLALSQTPIQDRQTAALIHEATRGLPLILRSVLSGLPKQNGDTQNWALQHSSTPTSIREKAQTAIDSLTMYLAASMSHEEHDAACRLAVLGEVFSNEGATVMLADRINSLPQLLQKGILMKVRHGGYSLTSSETTDERFAFTHTLLHEALLTKAPELTEELLQLFESEVPLYSIMPMQQLSETVFKDSQVELIPKAMNAFVELASTLATSHRFSFIQNVYDAASHFYDRNHSRVDQSTGRDMWLFLLAIRLGTQNYLPASEEYQALTTEYLEITKEPSNLTIAKHRLLALSLGITAQRIHANPSQYIKSCYDEIDQLVSQFPPLRSTKQYIKTISIAINVLIGDQTPELILRSQRYVDEIRETTRTPTAQTLLNEFYSLVLNRIHLFLSDAEFEEVQALAKEALEYFDRNKFPIPLRRSFATFFTTTGQPRKALAFHQKYLESHYANDSTLSPIGALTQRFMIHATLGAPRNYLETAIESIWEMTHRGSDVLETADYSTAKYNIWNSTLTASCVQNDWDWANEIILQTETDPAVADALQVQIGLVFLYTANRVGLQDMIAQGNIIELFLPIVNAILTPNAQNLDRAYTVGSSILNTAIVRVNNIARRNITVALLDALESSTGEPLPKAMVNEIRNALRDALQWTVDRELGGYMKGLVRRAKKYLPTDEYAKWEKELDRLLGRLSREFNWKTIQQKPEGKINLSMIGTINYSLADEKPQRVLGLRARVILGLMAFNEISERPLSNKDFRKLAVDHTLDDEEAGGAMRSALLRLRSLLGKKAIISDRKSAPRLNLDLVHVDLIEASRLLHETTDAVRALRPRRAKQAVTRALEILQGEPAFPTLYDEIFEAARLDFDFRVREAVLSTAKLLYQEGDPDEAANLLSQAYNHMPSDDEIAEELTRLLQLVGRNAEAFRIKEHQRESMEEL